MKITFGHQRERACGELKTSADCSSVGIYRGFWLD